jgi:hypothetical protein
MQIISDIVVRDYLHKQSVDIVYGQLEYEYFSSHGKQIASKVEPLC